VAVAIFSLALAIPLPLALAVVATVAAVSAGRLEGVIEAVVRNLLSELHPRFRGEAVVEAAPRAGVHDVGAEFVRGVELPHRDQIPRGVGRTVDVEVDLVSAEELAEHLCYA
jgi:hypothetical protein